MINLIEASKAPTFSQARELIPTTDLVKLPVVNFMPDGCLYVNRTSTGKCPVVLPLTSCPAKRETPNGKLVGRCVAW